MAEKTNNTELSLIGRIGRRARRALGSINVKLGFKGAATAAALVAILIMMIAGADISPEALAHGLRDKYVFTHVEGEGYPTDVNGTRAVTAAPVFNGTAVLSDTTATIYDPRGRNVVSRAHYMANPAMSCSGRNVLVYDRMGKSFMLMTVSDEPVRGSASNPIVCGAVSGSGAFAFITSHEMSNSRVYVYSGKGESIHSWKSTRWDLTDIAVSPSGEYIAMSGISAQNGVLGSTVIVQKVGGTENLREYAFEGTLVFDLEFCGDCDVIAVGDDLMARLGVDAEKRKVYDYGGRTLTAYDISEKGNVGLSFSRNGDGRNVEIVVTDGSCGELFTIQTALNAPFVELTDNRVNILSGEHASSYDYDGNAVASAEVPADCQSLVTSCGSTLARCSAVVSVVEWNDVE